MSIFSGAELTINLENLTHNWKSLSAHLGQSECAACVKANAYGIGLKPAVEALEKAGCRSFFVALPEEARALRALSNEAIIYQLHGLMGEVDFYLEHDIRPCLASMQQVQDWLAGNTTSQKTKAALHVDTGINRMGISASEAQTLASNTSLLKQLNLSLVMSHMACADTPTHPMNAQQISRFEQISNLFPNLPASLANSATTLSRPEAHYDIARCGIALYGGRALEDMTQSPVTLKPVISLHAPIMQIREQVAGETVGYGATATLARNSRLAFLSVGYGDGYPRIIGHDNPHVAIAGQHAPILGHISMDQITVDITDIPDTAINVGTMVEIIGDHVPLAKIADYAQTIDYEILTSLGSRYKRRYI